MVSDSTRPPPATRASSGTNAVSSACSSSKNSAGNSAPPGPAGDSDQTYGALGTIVAERAIGVDGPIREYYLVPISEPDPARHRTEICWPVFQTA